MGKLSWFANCANRFGGVDAKTAINNMPLALIKGTPKHEESLILQDVLNIIDLHSRLECVVAKKALGEALYHIHVNSNCTKNHRLHILKKLTSEDQLTFFMESIEPRKTGGGIYIG